MFLGLTSTRRIYESIPIMFALKDVILKESACDRLLLEKHAEFIKSYQQKENDYEYVMSEFLRMSGIYWCLTAMDLMGRLPEIDRQKVLDFVLSCKCSNGGFAASPGHDAHILYTLSAVQILALYDSLELLDCESIVSYVKSLQYADGSFIGDEFGEMLLDIRVGQPPPVWPTET